MSDCPLKNEEFRKMLAFEVAQEVGRLLLAPSGSGISPKAVFDATIRYLEFRDQVCETAREVVKELEKTTAEGNEVSAKGEK